MKSKKYEVNIFISKKEKLEIKLESLNQKENPNYLIEYKKEKLKASIKYLDSVIEILNDKSIADKSSAISIAKEKKRQDEILYGNITATILIVCMPIAIYQFFNSMYNLIDAVMCATISASAVNSVAVLAQVKNAIAAFGAGIAGGGAVLVSRYYGAKRNDEAKKTSGNILFIILLMSLVICLILIPFASVILSFLGVSRENNTTLYFQLQIIELAIVAINTLFIGLEKVKGNSKKIFYFNIAVLLIKLGLNAIFIYGMNVESVVWIELSSIISQLFLFVIGVKTLFSNSNILKMSFSDVRPERKYMVPIIKLAFPVFLGKFVMNIGKVTVNYMAGLYYNSTTNGLIAGALAVSNNLSGVVTGATSSFEEGESAIVSQNIGNKNTDRTIKAFISTFAVVMVISITGFILVRFVYLDELVGLFSSSKSKTPEENERLINIIKEVFVYDSISIPALGIAAAVLGLLYGYGKTFLASIFNFLRIGTRVLTLFILHFSMDYTAVGVAMGVSNVIIGLLAIFFLLIFMVRRKKEAERILNKFDY